MSINPIDYPGSVGHFRAWMDRFLARKGDMFSISVSQEINEYKVDYTPVAQTSTREVWHVKSIVPFANSVKTKKQRHGMILASEELPNKTIVEFIDGAYYAENQSWVLRSMYDEHPTNLPPAKPEKVKEYPIGDDFIQLVESIKSEWGKEYSKIEANVGLQEPKTRILKDWFDYLHAVEHRTRIKLRYIADKAGLSYSTVKKEHSLYMKEKGIRKVTKSNKK